MSGMNIPLSFGASRKAAYPGLRPSVYYPSPVVALSTATTTPTADVLYAQPFWLPDVRITRVGIKVTSGVAGACRLGIYENDATLAGPSNLLLDAGAIDTSATGWIESTIDFTGPDGWVWIAGIFNATPTVLGGGSDAHFLLGSSASDMVGGGRGLVKTSTPYGAMPTVAPVMSATVGNTGMPAFAVRSV